jgi:peptide/nickel transport system substrate-binding protein
MQRRQFIGTGAAALGVAATAGLARPALAASASVLKFVPQANLSVLDPIWTTATVAANHGFLVWDTLYGVTAALEPKPQMLAGHEISDDKLTWTFTLRDGLLWHDGERVRPIDCTTSIKRWGQRNGFGQRLISQTAEMQELDDKRFRIILNKPFPMLPYALGSQNCFVMPERIARTDGFKQITEYVGSGPFIFLKDELVSGAHAAYRKFDRYVPRDELPDYWTGGKKAYFERIEWLVMPDPATSAAALQTGEIDWIELPLFDLLPELAKKPGVVVEKTDPLGVVGIIAFNHLYPPFDNPKLLRALLPAIDQKEFEAAVVGDQPGLTVVPVGTFTVGTPMANTARLEALSGPRDIGLAKKLVAESGYKGEKILLMSPSDIASLNALAQVTQSVFQEIGLNVDYRSMDWGSLVARRAVQDPPEKGGWNCFCTSWGGLQMAEPGGHYPLRGIGRKGWFGWMTSPALEQMRGEWFDAPDLATQKRVAEAIQREAMVEVPYIPVGQWFQPIARRDSLTGIVHCTNPLFWGVRRV